LLRKPVIEKLGVGLVTAKVVKFRENRTREYIFDKNLSSPLGIKEKKELSSGDKEIVGLLGLWQRLKIWEGWHDLRNETAEVLLLQVAVSVRIIKRDLDPGLKKTHFPDD